MIFLNVTFQESSVDEPRFRTIYQTCQSSEILYETYCRKVLLGAKVRTGTDVPESNSLISAMLTVLL
jgi:hypothetical protein